LDGGEISLDDFFDSTRDDLEHKISSTIPDEKIVTILKGGKRLRSLLAQLTFKACTEGKETHDEYQKSLEGSVSIELAHGASLVHDDIIDKDIERRGRPAFHIKEGIGKALLMGHKMLVHGFDIALSHGKDVAKLYVDSWNEVVTGEIEEVDFNKIGLGSKEYAKEAIFEAYNKIIDLKTAVLFSSACKAGALEANMSGDILKVFSDYGREIGLAYQLADDLVDLANGEMIDSVIIPLINRIESKKFKIGALKKREIKRKFAKNKDKIKEYYIEEIKKHVKEAERLGESDIIPDSSYKRLLMEAPTYIINRMLGEINVTV
jgi:octaprenyl-diphosphate synthase